MWSEVKETRRSQGNYVCVCILAGLIYNALKSNTRTVLKQLFLSSFCCFFLLGVVLGVGEMGGWVDGERGCRVTC